MNAQRALHYSRTAKDFAQASAPASPKKVNEADVTNLLDIIEGQRQSLEKRAEIIKTLQSDVGALGQRLMEERNRANHNNSLHKEALRELEALKSITSTAGNTPRDDHQHLRDQFKLHSQLDNLQHLLDVKTKEVSELQEQLKHLKGSFDSENSQRAEDEDAETELLQSQIVWLKRENEKLAHENWEKEGRIQRMQKRLKQLETEAKQSVETIVKTGIDLQNRQAEIERNNKEIRELKDRLSHVQLPSQKSHITRGPFTEEDLSLQISSFKSQAMSIAGRLSSVHRDKSFWEERLKSQHAKRQQLSSSVDIIRRQLEDEQGRRRAENEALENSVVSLNADLERVNAEMRTTKGELAAITAEMGVVKEDAQVAHEQVAKLTKENYTAKRDLEESKIALKQAKKALIRLEAELTSAEVHTADYAQIRQDNSSLRKQCADAERELKAVKEELLAKQSNLETLENELISAKRIKSQWEAGLGELEKKVKSTESMMITCKQLQNTVNELNEAKQRLESIVISTQDRRKDQEIAKLEENSKQMATEVEKSLRNQQDLQELIANLTSELQSKLPSREEVEIRLAEIQLKEAALKAALAKAKNATRAIESDLTCIVCLSLVTEAVVCQPCGHFYCKRCRAGYHPCCQQCGQRVKNVQKVNALDDIAAKVKYRKRTVELVGSA